MSKLYTLENDKLKIAVSAHGAEFSSLFDKEKGRELLWQGDSAFWGRKSPVLFPVVGKYRSLKTTYKGKEYSLPQHGFARDSEFTLLQSSDSRLEFLLESNEKTLKDYPFKFRLICSFSLNGGELTVGWRVENTDCEDIYFSIGAHPAFYCEKGATVLNIEGVQSPAFSLLNGDGLFLPEKYPCPASFVLNDEIFDRDALIFENSEFCRVTLVNEDNSSLSVEFTAPLFGIWSPAGKNAPFVCIEPWYGRCDSADFEGDITAREWGNRLAVGEAFEKEYKIII